MRPQKDELKEHPVPHAWRPTLGKIVDGLVQHDYQLDRRVDRVKPISEATARQIREYISDYGERLIALPADTWKSSVAQWMGGYWDVLVDLWTEAEGPSDLVLSVRVTESDGSFEYEVQLVFVP